MASTVDLRTYLLLERAFVRRLQRSWREQSAPIYAALAEHCRTHQWDKARQRVPDLDMAEVGTENREWITYMLLSCAAFGAGTVANGKPSFVGVGSFDTLLKQVTTNLLQYLELTATAQVQAEALQLIAEDEAKTKALPKVAFDEAKHPRDKEGQFTDRGAGALNEVYAQRDLEGAGPERQKWMALNQAAMEAFDQFMEAKIPHRLNVRRVQAKVEAALKAGAPQDETEWLWQKHSDPEYLASKRRLQAAEQARTDADAALKYQEPMMRTEIVRNLATSVALRLGVDPDLITVVHQQPRAFTVGEKQFTEAGHFNPATGRIQLNAQNINYGDAQSVKGIVAHEVSHLVYHQLKQQGEAEFNTYLSLALNPHNSDEYTPWFEEHFERKSGEYYTKHPRPEKRAALEQMFPASAVLAKMSGGDLFAGIATEMVNENGHSAYAKSYWTKDVVAARGHTYESAITETVAEITRYLAHPSSWHEPQSPQPSSPWTKLTVAMHHWYKEGNPLRKAGIARIRAEHAR